MKIPGITTILLYHFVGKEHVSLDESIKLFIPSDLVNNKWILEYFPGNICDKRWQDGNKLFYLVNKDGIPCSFAWFKNDSKHFVGELNKTLIFPYKVNCFFDCITPIKYRGQGYYPTLINKLSMKELIYPNIIYASSSNRASNKGILKAKFELTHRIFRFLDFVKITGLNNSGINFYAKKIS